MGTRGLREFRLVQKSKQEPPLTASELRTEFATRVDELARTVTSWGQRVGDDYVIDHVAGQGAGGEHVVLVKLDYWLGV